MISGSGSTGWSVAVSLLAPFAVIALGTTANYEDGSSDDPGIPTSTICKIGEQYDPEAEFRNAKGEEAFATLMKVRVRICGILSRYGIHVLPEEEWRKPVPWLRAAEEVLVGEPICVLDAFFFAML
jgi:hypothetical protein